MCGIFGWSWKEDDSRQEKVVIAAILANEMEGRGAESWGYYNPALDLLNKGAGRITTSVKAMELAAHPLLFVHTRKATTGQICKENAHPFRGKEIVGAHNGMVSNHVQMNIKHKRECPVDSMHLFLHYEEKLPLEEIHAYGAVEFARAGDPQIKLAAFNGGDLAVFKVPGLGIIWASTSSACETALGLAGLKHSQYQIEEEQVYLAQAGELYLSGEEQFAPKEYLSLSYSGYSDYSGKARAIARGDYYLGKNMGRFGGAGDDYFSNDWYEKEELQELLQKEREQEEEADLERYMSEFFDLDQIRRRLQEEGLLPDEIEDQLDALREQERERLFFRDYRSQTR